MMQLTTIIFSVLLVFSCTRQPRVETFVDDNSKSDNLSLANENWENSKFCPEDPLMSDVEDMISGFPRDFIDKKLSSEDGLTGWVHGSASQMGYYVFTYRSEDKEDPMAFFKAEEFSLVSRDPEIQQLLSTLKRHDKISLKGQIIPSRSPLRHISVSSLKIIEPYKKRPFDYEYKTKLETQNGEILELFGKIHTVIADGKALVFEYGDLVVPVFVDPSLHGLTSDFYRNDKVALSVRAVKGPRRPLHFYLNKNAETPFKVIDRIKNCHGVTTELKGQLVKFDKSPQINRDIYAVKITDRNNVERNFTFFPDVSFSNPPTKEESEKFMSIFSKISAKVTKAWEENKDSAELARNHSVNPLIRISVSGRMNIVSKTQANPQIYITHPDDLIIEVLGN